MVQFKLLLFDNIRFYHGLRKNIMYIVVIVMIMNILSCDLKKLSNMKPTVFFGFLDFFFLSIAH